MMVLGVFQERQLDATRSVRQVLKNLDPHSSHSHV